MKSKFLEKIEETNKAFTFNIDPNHKILNEANPDDAMETVKPALDTIVSLHRGA